METGLTALVTSGATTVVTLMASDAWNAMRSRIVELLHWGSTTQEDRGRAEIEVDSERCGVMAAWETGEPMMIADLEAVWRVRLRQLLREDPSAAALLRELIKEGSSVPGPVHNIINGGEFRRAVIQAGDIHGDVHLG